MREIRYLGAARAELDAAVVWYRDHRTAGVAEMFLTDVSDAILQIAELPDAWPVSRIDSRVRVRHLRRLRFGLFDVVDREAVTIVAIAHTRRRPGYGLGRIR
jgi:toxin ParE1/3/4